MFHVPAQKAIDHSAAQISNIDVRPFWRFNEQGNLEYREPTISQSVAFEIAERNADEADAASPMRPQG